MRSQLAYWSTDPVTTAYSWYLNSKAIPQGPKYRAPRIVVYSKLTPKPQDYKLNKAQGGFNWVFWRPKLPLRGLVGVLIFSSVAMMYAQALMGWVSSLVTVALAHPLLQGVLCYSPALSFLGLLLLCLLRKGIYLNSLGARGTFKTNGSLWTGCVTLAFSVFLGAHLGGFLSAPLTVGAASTDTNPLNSANNGISATERPELVPTYHVAWHNVAGNNLRKDCYLSFLRKVPTLVFRANVGSLILSHTSYSYHPTTTTPGAYGSSPTGFLVSSVSLTQHIRLSSISSLGDSRVWASLAAQPHERAVAVRLLISAWRVSTEVALTRPNSPHIFSQNKVTPFAGVLCSTKVRSQSETPGELTTPRSTFGGVLGDLGHELTPTFLHKSASLRFGMLQTTTTSLKTKPWSKL